MKRGLLLVAVALAGCVGPNFKRPAPPVTSSYTSAPLPAGTAAAPGAAGDAQRFLQGGEVPRNWWTLFSSEDLNTLVNEALKANPDVQAAQAALRQARENTAAQRGSYFPSVTGSFEADRARDATGVLQPNLASGQPVYNLFTPQVSVSFVPDVFGANRRQVESLAAQAEAAHFQLDATYLTLTANVVTAAVGEAGLNEQIAATRKVIGLEREALGILQHELELGSVSEADVFAQEASLAQLESTLPPLQKQLGTTHDQLAILLGRAPADLPMAERSLAQFTLPSDLPLGIPSQLVDRRPDVRAAEAQLHAATANVGVAITNFLPQFTITGNAGSTATAMADLFKAGTGFWSLSGNVSETLFAGGTLLHKKRAADAALDQAAANYKSAVLTAFQNVADALHALNADADMLEAASRARDAAERSLKVARRQLDLGSVSYLALTTSEQAYQQALVTEAQARANRLTDTAALFQALGGSITPAR
jgi:NodT family efflux transporter outer membrane factor (OMF) lipoprotein